jgi:hypothetical protein
MRGLHGCVPARSFHASAIGLSAARRAPPRWSLCLKETVTLALLPFGKASNAMKGSLIDGSRSAA